jgi:hypothetical protein
MHAFNMYAKQVRQYLELGRTCRIQIIALRMVAYMNSINESIELQHLLWPAIEDEVNSVAHVVIRHSDALSLWHPSQQYVSDRAWTFSIYHDSQAQDTLALHAYRHLHICIVESCCKHHVNLHTAIEVRVSVQQTCAHGRSDMLRCINIHNIYISTSKLRAHRQAWAQLFAGLVYLCTLDFSAAAAVGSVLMEQRQTPLRTAKLVCFIATEGNTGSQVSLES